MLNSVQTLSLFLSISQRGWFAATATVFVVRSTEYSKWLLATPLRPISIPPSGFFVPMHARAHQPTSRSSKLLACAVPVGNRRIANGTGTNSPAGAFSTESFWIHAFRFHPGDCLIVNLSSCDCEPNHASERQTGGTAGTNSCPLIACLCPLQQVLFLFADSMAKFIVSVASSKPSIRCFGTLRLNSVSHNQNRTRKHHALRHVAVRAAENSPSGRPLAT